jgi:hypothetical protein
VSFDTWVFFLVISLPSALGLPIVLLHVATDDTGMLGIILESSGCLVGYIGFLLHAIGPRLACGDGDGLFSAWSAISRRRSLARARDVIPGRGTEGALSQSE